MIDQTGNDNHSVVSGRSLFDLTNLIFRRKFVWKKMSITSNKSLSDNHSHKFWSYQKKHWSYYLVKLHYERHNINLSPDSIELINYHPIVFLVNINFGLASLEKNTFLCSSNKWSNESVYTAHIIFYPRSPRSFYAYVHVLL